MPGYCSQQVSVDMFDTTVVYQFYCENTVCAIYRLQKFLDYSEVNLGTNSHNN